MQTNIPSNIVSGLTVEWTKRLTDYDPSLWTLSYHLRSGNGDALTATATDNGDGCFLVSLAAVSGVVPKPVPTGVYFFQAYVTNIADTSIKRQVDNGRVNVTVDLSDMNVTTYDGRSQAELMLEAIDALLSKKALTPDQMSYTIGQRTLTRIPHDQLLQFRNYYVGIVQAEYMKARAKKGLPIFDNVLTKFRRPR